MAIMETSKLLQVFRLLASSAIRTVAIELTPPRKKNITSLGSSDKADPAVGVVTKAWTQTTCKKTTEVAPNQRRAIESFHIIILPTVIVRVGDKVTAIAPPVQLTLIIATIMISINTTFQCAALFLTDDRIDPAARVISCVLVLAN
jgi:hypothetical protein